MANCSSRQLVYATHQLRAVLPAVRNELPTGACCGTAEFETKLMTISIYYAFATLGRKARLAHSLGRHQPHFAAGENQPEVLPPLLGRRALWAELTEIAGPLDPKTSVAAMGSVGPSTSVLSDKAGAPPAAQAKCY